MVELATASPTELNIYCKYITLNVDNHINIVSEFPTLMSARYGV